MIRVPMNVARLLVAALVLDSGLAAALAGPKTSPWNAAVEKFEKLNGELSIQTRGKHRHLYLNLSPTKATDADLKGLADLVPAQQRVASATLDLRGTRITDGALKEVAKLGRKVPLTLVLDRTEITDAGLKALKGAAVTTLSLASTKITDAGLKELKGIKGLSTLNLAGTNITNGGLTDLKKAMPGCKITR